MKKKLKIEELKVQSFITELKPDIARTAKGGEDSTPIASSAPCTAVSVAATALVWGAYTDISKANSWFPYNHSTECTKVTTGNNTSTTKKAA